MSDSQYKIHGHKPPKIAVIHGGPGAAGEMAPVAKYLSKHMNMSVLEPHQSTPSIDIQIKELLSILNQQANLPITLIGFSWGAWIACLLATHYPHYVSKLILIGCGPFEKRYADRIRYTRLARLNHKEQEEYSHILKSLNSQINIDLKSAINRLGQLALISDTYEPIPTQISNSDINITKPNNIASILSEGLALRDSGELLEITSKISCPVTAIHGDYDPHPAEGVKKSLRSTIPDLQFYLLHNCGHKPWIEKYASDNFHNLLVQQIAD